jgi:flagellar motor switch protein FliN/FliY
MSDLTEAPHPAKDARSSATLDLLAGVTVRLSVEVGATFLTLAELVELDIGSVVALDRQVHEPLDICANGAPIARGEIIATDGRYGIRITELVAGNGGLAGLERRT